MLSPGFSKRSINPFQRPVPKTSSALPGCSQVYRKNDVHSQRQQRQQPQPQPNGHCWLYNWSIPETDLQGFSLSTAKSFEHHFKPSSTLPWFFLGKVWITPKQMTGHHFMADFSKSLTMVIWFHPRNPVSSFKKNSHPPNRAAYTVCSTGSLHDFLWHTLHGKNPENHVGCREPCR